jgi:flagellar basal-body rod protein FlgF
MLRGLYTATSGMVTESLRTDVIANNLANVNTVGYKKDETISAEFEAVLLKRINDGQVTPDIGGLGRGSRVDEIATIHEQGATRQTGNKYDVAIEGAGYFVVDTPNGTRYTRAGSFVRSDSGDLVTESGARVLDQKGRPIRIPDGTNVTIGAKGNVVVDNQTVGTLGFVQFSSDKRLTKEGNNLYVAPPNEPTTPATGTLEQGSLEMSNVNVVSEMVKLINGYRTYEANSKAVTTQDSLLDKAVNQVGTV